MSLCRNFALFLILVSSPAQATSGPSATLHQKVNCGGRSADVFGPSSHGKVKIPVVVFGHGQILGVEHYEKTLEYLAQNGVAVIFPQYDLGFFDQDWKRMGRDYASIAQCVLSKNSGWMDENQVVFSGHSKGAYIALTAAGAPTGSQYAKPKSVLVFEPAGYDEDYIRKIDPRVPVSMTVGDQDSITPAKLTEEIYSHLTVKNKQIIYVKSGEVKADHFFVLTKGFFGPFSPERVTQLHTQGTWKWLLGAVMSDDRLYGARALESGWPRIAHGSLRSFSVFDSRAGARGVPSKHNLLSVEPPVNCP